MTSLVALRKVLFKSTPVKRAESNNDEISNLCFPGNSGVVIGTNVRVNNESDELVLTLNIADFNTLSNGYTCFPGAGCYKFHNNSVTFAEAKRICENEGAYLPIISSAKEASALVAVYHPYYEPDKEWPRIGFGDFFGKGDFVTIIGEHINSTGHGNWYHGEPRTTYDRNCNAMNIEGKMGTQCCDCNIWFFCEVKIK